MMTRDGRDLDHNLYGNLTETKNRRATAISKNSLGDGNSNQRMKLLQRSAGSIDAELSFSRLETDSAGIGSLETQTIGLPQLPKSSRKPRHILV